MNRQLQILVAVTCVVVIGGIGSWLWQNYSNVKAAEERAVFDEARSVCMDELSRYAGFEKSLKDQVTACASHGYIGTADIEAAKAANAK